MTQLRFRQEKQSNKFKVTVWRHAAVGGICKTLKQVQGDEFNSQTSQGDMRVSQGDGLIK